MKTRLLLLILLPALVKAQYCGNSGPAVCTPVYYDVDTNKASDRELDSLPCVVRGVPYNEAVSIRTDSFCMVFSSQYVCIDINSYHVDSMWGLPPGICWSTNDIDNTVYSGQWICLNFSGITNAAAGAYKVRFMVDVSVDVPTQGIPDPQTFYLRVVEPGAPCQASVIYNAVSEVEEVLPEVKLVGDKLVFSNAAPQSVVSVYDLAGRLLKQQTLQQLSGEVDVTDVRGMFLVNLSYNGMRHTQKFVR